MKKILVFAIFAISTIFFKSQASEFTSKTLKLLLSGTVITGVNAIISKKFIDDLGSVERSKYLRFVHFFLFAALLKGSADGIKKLYEEYLNESSKDIKSKLILDWIFNFKSKFWTKDPTALNLKK